MKTNQQKNKEHDQRQTDRIRPKAKEWNFEPLEAVIKQWKERPNEPT
jgi:hypothetical protein